MKKLFILIALLSCLICAMPAPACDLCAIYSATETRENKPGIYAGVFEQYTHFGTLAKGGEEIPDPAHQFMNSSITLLIAGYQFNERVGVQLNLPWIHRYYKRPEGFEIQRGTVDGLGDLSLLGNVRLYEGLYRDSMFIWSAVGGVKFPSGSPLRLKEEQNEMATPPGAPVSGIHGHDLTLGSGSYDGIIGSSVAYYRGRLFATSGAQYAIRSTGSFDYRFANDLNWSFKPGYYLVASHEATLGVQLSVTGEVKGKDEFKGKDAVDTGITSVFLGPEITFTLGEILSGDLEAEFPVLVHNTNIQEVPDYRLRAALGLRF